MFSIQKLIGRDEKFYDLLEASAQQADTSVHQLIGLLQKLEQHDTPENLEQFAHSRREDKRITQELIEQLSKTFVTPLEREDIQELAAALYKIPKTVEKIGERILICPEDLAGQSFGKQVELLDQAAEMVLAMVNQLRHGINARNAREMNAKLQGIEGDADKLELERLRDLFKGDHSAKQIIFLHDLYGLLEKVIDRCRDAGNIIVQVALNYASQTDRVLTLILVILAAVIFEYSNGFHDAANAIATVVSTRVLTPRQAIAMAAFFNLTGALFGGAVAATIGKGLVDTEVVTMTTVLCAVLAAFSWNIATWWLGLPSSSSHALIGGVCGAALASAKGDWSVIKWKEGMWPKVVLPMIASPIAGFVFGALFMFLLLIALHRFTPQFVHSLFGKLQIFSAAWMAHSHGTNDAQKTMGIITLALFTGTKAGSVDNWPRWLDFLKTPWFVLPTWVIALCAVTMAAGTAAGGWRIIRTVGHRVVKLQPVHGFAAETTAALIIQVASYYGIPLSTTHVISTSIMGVGAVKRFSGIRWTVVERIVWAWIFTLPATALIGYMLERAVGTRH